ncbi:S-layer homology domain-containing protein [Paenibacillus sp. GD4]|uniref:S-layer homology domain-containing protein n=1 Tax=Paenibacillus sp. GD4 TaxID=3068890 RepID=UPI0027966F18|nr:S-layer homology domain-containing protein [Paenibacillus sp. GD4]MDQ1911627.1 S-layer homology domain-containing protein [Paenibacillus sp. GD4]
MHNKLDLHALLRDERRRIRLKSAVMKKMSKVLCVLLIVSMFLPVLASAATIEATYDGSSVSGSVYSDVYYDAPITITVYGPDSTTLITTTTATYSVYNSVYRYDIIPVSISMAYPKVVLKTVEDSVYDAVYSSYVAPGDSEAPTWPINPSLSVTDVTYKSLSLSWPVATDNMAVVSYEVWKNGNFFENLSFGTNSLSVTGLTYSTEYTFAVKAKDAQGNASSTLSATVTTLPEPSVDPQDTTPPSWSNKTLTATNITKTSLVLNWTAATDVHGPIEYFVYQGQTKLTTVTDVTYNVSGLTGETSYTFSILAKDAKGNVTTDGPTGTFKTDKDNNDNGSSGGGAPAGGLTTAAGKIEANNGKVDASVLSKAFEATSKVEIKVTGEKAELSAAGLVEAAKKSDAAVTIVSDKGTYTLPLSVLKLDALAKSLGVDVKDLTVSVSITVLSGDAATGVSSAVSTAGATSVADAVDFAVTVTGKDGKAASVDFGKTYVSRSLNATKALDSKKATGVLYNPETKKLSFVPTTFETKDGKTVATLKRNGNSIYTVVEVNKSFSDLANHWSKADVELLANKLVVEGVAEGKFDAERSITRAEFAALVVRSLGLTEVSGNGNFKDVSAGAWYASTVATAVNAGIINGYEDNTFRPDATITREELAAMVIRALSYAGVASEVSNPQDVLKKFKDANDIVWAQKELAAAVNAKIINGLTDDKISSSSQATRAQAATMLKRFLDLADFIN